MSDNVEFVMEDAMEIKGDASEREEARFNADVPIPDEEKLKEYVIDFQGWYVKARAEREEREKSWEKWRRQFEAQPKSKVKDYPYKRASNVVPPLSQIIGQSIFAHLLELYDVNPPWYVKPLKKDNELYLRQAEVLTKYLNIISESPQDLDFENFKYNFINEVAIMGTCYPKVVWSTVEWGFRENGMAEGQEAKAYVHDGPELIAVPVEDFLYCEGFTDIQRMPRIAHDFKLAGYELKNLVSEGVFDGDAVEKVMGGGEGDGVSSKEQNMDDIMRGMPSHDDEFILTEYYQFYDADGDGKAEDVVMVIHEPTGIVLSQGYNDFGRRMFGCGRYIRRTYRLEGRGSGQTTEYHQDEIEGIHNSRNDSIKFSSIRMVIARRNVFREDEEIYPGKVLVSDNPKEDVTSFQMGEIYPSSMQAENLTMELAREANAMPSIMSGFSDQRLGSRDTARGQGMRLSRGQGLFASIAQGLDSAFREIGEMIFLQLVRHKERVIESERQIGRLTEDELMVLEDTLNMPVFDMPSKLAFVIRTTDIDQTFEAKRQNTLALTQLFSQYAQQTPQLVMMLFGPQGQQLQKMAPDAFKHLLAVYTGSTRLMKDVFEFFGKDDPGKYVPDVRKHEMMLDMLKALDTQALEKQMRGGIEEGMREESGMGRALAGIQSQEGQGMEGEGGNEAWEQM
jgi:hypothetical protein